MTFPHNKNGLLFLMLFVSSYCLAQIPVEVSEPVTGSDSTNVVAQNDSLDTAIPNPEDRLPFELPDVVVRGEDLSIIVGGARLDGDQPALDLSPLGRPQIPDPPKPVIRWRRHRPFQLIPTLPVSHLTPQSVPRSYIQLHGGPLPDAGFRFVTGGGNETAWRLDAGIDWAEDPVPHTNRRTLNVKYQSARGFWPRNRWNLRGEFSARRLDWDLQNLQELNVKGPQRFTGVRFGFDRAGMHSEWGLRFEGATFDWMDRSQDMIYAMPSIQSAESSQWALMDFRWDRSSKSSHPALRTPEFSLWARGIQVDQSERTFVHPASGLFEDPSGDWDSWRGLGEVRMGLWVTESSDLDIWFGLQGLWDDGRGFISPHLLTRWSLIPSRMIIWSELVASVKPDPWWDEGRDRDYAIQNLHRESTIELPALKVGGEWEEMGWRLRGEAAVRRLRSPRTWREDAISGFYLPATTEGRWTADGQVAWLSPGGRFAGFELSAGFFHDGDGEVLAFQPQLWMKLKAKSSLGPYTGRLTLEGWDETPQNDSKSLPRWMTANIEVGRTVGSIGRFWFRVNNIMDDPANRWPFVDGSQRSYHLGWDIHFGSL